MRMRRSMGMRRFKTLLVFFMIAAGGTFLSFQVIKLAAADPYLDMTKFADVFTGYRPKYRRGWGPEEKAREDWKAGYINNALDQVIFWVFIFLAIFSSLGIIAAFKVYSGTWWQ